MTSFMHNVEHETCLMPKEAILARTWRPTLAPPTKRIPTRNQESAKIRLWDADPGHDQNHFHAYVARSGQAPTIYEPNLATKSVRPCHVDNCPRSLVRPRYVYFGSPHSSMLVTVPACSAEPLVEFGLPPESNTTCVDSMSINLLACSAAPLEENGDARVACMHGLAVGHHACGIERMPTCPAGPLDGTKALHEFPRYFDRRCTPSFLPSSSCDFACVPMSSNMPACSVGPLETIASSSYSSSFDSMR